MPYRVFIGYSHEDEEKAQSIHDALNRITQIEAYKAENYPVYGEDFKARIKQRISSSDLMVVLLTANGKFSQWVNQEIGFAFATKGFKKNFKIIPIVENTIKDELKGFITKDSVDVLFLDEYAFETIIGIIITCCRQNIFRGSENNTLKVRIFCDNCGRNGQEPEYHGFLPSNNTVWNIINSGNMIAQFTCPRCNWINDVDLRTLQTIKTHQGNSSNLF